MRARGFEPPPPKGPGPKPGASANSATPACCQPTEAERARVPGGGGSPGRPGTPGYSHRVPTSPSAPSPVTARRSRSRRDRGHGAVRRSAADVAGRIRYLDEVMAEIDAEVRRRRASGDLPAGLERELDELFLEFSPVGLQGRARLRETLSLVDGSAYVDIAVPTESQQGGGQLRQAVSSARASAGTWASSSHQIVKFAWSVSRMFHVVVDHIEDLEAVGGDAPVTRPARSMRCRPADPGSSLVGGGRRRRAGRRDRTGCCVADCGDGSLVGRTGRRRASTPTGWIPRTSVLEPALDRGLDVRAETVLDHLEVVAGEALGGIVLTGSVQWLRPNERERLVDLVAHPPGRRRRRWSSTRRPRRRGRPVAATRARPGTRAARSTPRPGPTCSAARGFAGGRPPVGRRRPPAGPGGTGADRRRHAERRHRRGQRSAARVRRSTSWSPCGSGDRRPPVRAGAAAPGRHRGPHAGPARRPAGRRVGVGHLRRGGPRRAAGRGHLLRGVPGPGTARATSCSTSWARRRRWPNSCSAGPSPWSSTTTTSRPPSFYEGWEDHTAAKVALAREQVAALAPRAVLGIADSAFNAGELRRWAARPPRSSRSWSTSDGRPVPASTDRGSWPGWPPARRGHRAPLRRADLAQQGPAAPGRGALGLPALVRPRCPAPPGGSGGDPRLRRRGVRLGRRAGPGRRRAPRRGPDRGRAGRLVRRRRRVRVPVRARGVLHPPARGDAGRYSRSSPSTPGRCPRRWATPGSCSHRTGRRRWPPPSTGCAGTRPWPTGWWRPGTGGCGDFAPPPTRRRFVEVLGTRGRPGRVVA